MNVERREHVRVPTSITVRWEGATGRYEVRTTDISMSGCFVDTVGQVRVGELIIFELALAGGESLELRGEVVNVYPNVGFGVRFINVDQANEKRLESLIKTEARKQG